MHRALALVMFCFALSACSAKGDLEKICNAAELSGAAGITDPSQRAQTIARWVGENVKSTEGKNVLEALPMVPPQDRGKLLKAAAEEVGYTGPCPMADAR